MASLSKGLGPVKRLGTRYGRTLKYKLAKIEVEQKAKHKCPFCLKLKVYRLSAGIWHCSTCKNTFAAKAYTVGSPTKIVEEMESMVAQAPSVRPKEVVEDEE